MRVVFELLFWSSVALLVAEIVVVVVRLRVRSSAGRAERVVPPAQDPVGADAVVPQLQEREV